MSGSADGVGAAARFNEPGGVATDTTGNVYVADTGNNTVRKITRAGAVTTIVGVAGTSGFVPGPLPGHLDSPRDIALSGTTLYITMRSSVVRVQNVP
jgi:DNA-binding beta-propeller fold protein YncE